jgi:hypothetical protein
LNIQGNRKKISWEGLFECLKSVDYVMIAFSLRK